MARILDRFSTRIEDYFGPDSSALIGPQRVGWFTIGWFPGGGGGGIIDKTSADIRGKVGG